MFHAINAFQVPDSGTGGTRLTLDVCAYDDDSIVDALRLDSLDRAPNPKGKCLLVVLLHT
jgi:hypothetical protein